MRKVIFNSNTSCLFKVLEINAMKLSTSSIMKSSFLITLFLIFTSTFTFGQTRTFVGTTPGSGQYVVPPGVTSMTVESWGAGGKGTTRTSDGTGAGGGGGAYSRSVINVTPGQILYFTVGAGSTTTAAGGTSWVRIGTNAVPTLASQGVLSVGGASPGDNSNTGGAGGNQASGIGTIRFSGGNGRAGAGNNGGGGGSSAGTASVGTLGGIPAGGVAPAGGGNGGSGAINNNNTNGFSGIVPGGGGGGANRDTGTRVGGSGANGQIRFSFAENNICDNNNLAFFSPSGDAALVTPNYRLTTATSNQAGQIWSNYTINMNNDFVMEYNANFGSDAAGADGMAFVFRGFNTPNVGVPGEGIGYGNIPTSIAVEFDTFQNDLAGVAPYTGQPTGDPAGNHTAVHVGGNWTTSGRIGSNVVLGGGNIKDGNNHFIQIFWNKATNTLTTVFDGIVVNSVTRDFIALDLGGNPNVLFGMTASTGGSVNQHQLCITNVTQCPAGNSAPTFSTPSGNLSCTSSTINLNTFVTNQPANTQVRWYTTPSFNGTQVPDPTSVSATGDYYAFFFSNADNCYSPVSQAFTVNGALCADLETTISVDEPNQFFGQNVVFTINAINNGPINATGVVLTGLLPNGYTFVNATPSVGTYNPITGVWSVGNLVNAATAQLLVTAEVNLTGTYLYNVSITGNQDEGILANNNASSSVTPQNHADLSIIKTVDNMVPSSINDELTFTITVLNNGPSTSNSVVVNDVLPSGYNFISATPSQGSWLAPNWNVGSLISGASATIDIVVGLNITGNYSNTATVSAATSDLNSDNNSSTVNVYPNIQTADLTVIKEVNNSKPLVGTNVVFKLTAFNAGPNSTNNVLVTDLLPSGFTYVSHSGGTYDPLTGEWNISTLNSYTPVVLNITATVNGSGNYLNEVSISGEIPDPSFDNNTSSVLVEPTYPALQFDVVCPAFTYNLNSINTSNLPSGADLSWHTATPATSANVFSGNLAQAPAGTYYLAYYDANEDCYSSTTEVVVTTESVDCGVFAQDDINQTQLGVAVNGNLISNDFRGNEVVSASQGGTPITLGTPTAITGGTITINADGTYTFVPAPGFTGSVPAISYVADNVTGNTTDTANLYIEVVAPFVPGNNNDPIANADTATVNQDATANVNLLSNDSDLDNDTVSVTQITYNGTPISTNAGAPTAIVVGGQPAGTAYLAANGNLVFVANANFEGKVPFGYTISDGNGGTATSFVTITVVEEIEDKLYANDDATAASQGVTQTGNVLDNDQLEGNNPVVTTATATFNDIDYVLAPGVGTAIPGVGTITINANGSYTFVPEAGFTGTLPIEYTACNNETFCDNASLFITTMDACSYDFNPAAPDGFSLTGVTTLAVKRAGWPDDVPNGFIALESKNKGFVITRTTSGSIANPIEGMLIYDTTDNCFKLYNGTVWNCISKTCLD